jgi:hypothetical protein
MNMTEQTVQVTFSLPREVYERIAQAAAYEQHRLEDLLKLLVTEGLEAHVTLRTLFERISEQYRARLAREQKLYQSPDTILQDLRALREQVANELYS